MLYPSYHLEAVVLNRDVREDFTGPLDLILLLLSKNKIEIRDIRISELLDQYLAYLDKMREMDLEVASEFVQMASQLMLIKTKMLLAGDKEEVTELDVLVDALEQLQNRDLLRAVKEAAPELAERTAQGFLLHTHEPLPLPGHAWEYHHTPDELFQSVSSILLRQEKSAPDETSVRAAMPRPIAYGIKEKSEEIIERMRRAERVELAAFYASCESRSELVATFLSVLELCSAGLLRVEREERGMIVCRGENLECSNG